MLAAGTDPNAAVEGQRTDGEVFQSTPLCQAAGHGLLEVARLLLDGGADPGQADGDGYTPLMDAAGRGHLEVLRLLLRRDAAVDTVHPVTGGTAFHTACFGNQPECVEALARAGCDVSLKTKNEDSLGFEEMAELTGQGMAERNNSKEVGRRLRALARQPFVGVLVELTGLVGAAEHNGKRAMVRLRYLCLAPVCTLC
jgi:hypothetical protein